MLSLLEGHQTDANVLTHVRRGHTSVKAFDKSLANALSTKNPFLRNVFGPTLN